MAELKPNQKKTLKYLLIGFACFFVFINAIAFFHAWNFSHFNPNATKRVNGNKMSVGQKISAMFFGVDMPRPVNDSLPTLPYETITLQSNRQIECWYIKADSAIGTVALFHGYGGAKSSMLQRGYYLHSLGYNLLLADFMGSGGSEGNATTIGLLEGAQVKTCVDYLVKRGDNNICLFGTSMGAASILKAIDTEQLPVQSLILECPFGTMTQAVDNRFKLMGVPAFPMAKLLMFWGCVQTGCNLFTHSPANYAKKVKVPTLLLWGEQDDKVNREEIDAIYNNLAGPKRLITYPNARHESYLNKYSSEWQSDVAGFLATTKPLTNTP
ncbi:MAG: lysophospholipase [Sphingobacteriales bacterium JAD_PAG50586_3]|nr:MAG: lysophospholipase [Sphingobacteriales bacterium JAD_PAG50586_3]